MTTTAPQAIAAYRRWLALAGFVGLNLIVMVVGGLVTGPAVQDWYPGLAKPGWTPPDWVFGPAWGLLYAMMAVAAWLVWRRAGWRRGRAALVLYFIQLGLNFLWSPLFFGLRAPALGLLDIALLWAAIAATTLAFLRLSRLAGWLFVPYWAWVTYAAVLNFAIWRANVA